MAKINFDIEAFKKNRVLPVYHNDYLNYDHRYNVYYGGAGSGKSYYVVQKLITRCLLEPRKMLFTRKVDKRIRDSVFAEVKACINKMGFQKYVNIHNTTMTIEFPHNEIGRASCRERVYVLV